MIRVKYRHWKTGELLVVEGTLPEGLNNQSSDRIVVKTKDGGYEDIIRSTIVEMTRL